MPRDFQHQSQNQRQSLAEQLVQKLPRQEEVELSFLMGAPAPDVEPQTDWALLTPSPHWTQLTGIFSDGRARESCGFLIKKSDARS
jgi:hypothetical protein